MGGERAIVIPASSGWSYKYRASSMAAMKGCDNEATCALNNQDVLVKAYLAGYRKASCAAGDMPVSDW